MPVPRIAESPRLRLWSRFLRRLLSVAVVEKRDVCSRLERGEYICVADVGASGRWGPARPLRWQDCSARRRHGRAELELAMLKIAPLHVLRLAQRLVGLSDAVES